MINDIYAKLNSAKHTKTYRDEMNNNLKWANDISVSEEFTQAEIRRIKLETFVVCFTNVASKIKVSRGPPS